MLKKKGGQEPFFDKSPSRRWLISAGSAHPFLPPCFPYDEAPGDQAAVCDAENDV